MKHKLVKLGYEVGTGESVEIPLAHTFVTGQTQLSGKTTTLQAIVERSGARAIAFITKRGEKFPGRRIRPFLPRDNNKPIHWRLVEAIMAGALGQKNMKWERGAIVTVTKGATTLEQVRSNARHRMEKAKGQTAEIYMLLGEYLDLILPGTRALNAAGELDLKPGLNVMDLSGNDVQLQALVIRAALEQINLHEDGVLTVFPEAWEFAPRGRTATAKDEAIAMARKGAVLGNFLLCDSQDIAGVETTVRQAASVWILGVQRELNELKRTLDMIPHGIKKPKPADISTLSVGQFWACWGGKAVKTYVQPAWMSDDDARGIAMGEKFYTPPAPTIPDQSIVLEKATEGESNVKSGQPVCSKCGETIQSGQAVGWDNDALCHLECPSTRQMKEVGAKLGEAAARIQDAVVAGVLLKFENPLEEEFYQHIKKRLAAEAPAIINLLRDVPEIHIKDSVKTIEVDANSHEGVFAMMILDGFFDSGEETRAALAEMVRRGRRPDKAQGSLLCQKYAGLGFLTRETQKSFKTVPGFKSRLKVK